MMQMMKLDCFNLRFKKGNVYYMYYKRKINLNELKRLYEGGMTDITNLSVELGVSNNCVITNLKFLGIYNPKPQLYRPKHYNKVR